MALAWWQSGIVYQVYPRSFQDSDGDGTGDLRGILRRLDHLLELGVDALWISPVYPSPMTDFGYDVADYCDVDPVFGTLADLDALIAAAHARGLKIILDYVPNHTSDRHEWFVDSRGSRNSARRDWYLWHDPAPRGGPPNNWLSNFSGPAWTLDDASGQYYYHSFLPTQPDLNWRNPAVQAAMLDVLRFWMRRGVDGFRVDVMWMMIKDDQFRDNPPNPAWRDGDPTPGRLLPVYTADRPEVQDVVAALRATLDEFPDRVLIGELYLPFDRMAAYYGVGLRGAQMPFNFHLLLLTDWTAAALARLITDYEASLPPDGWPNWVLGNHDRPRVATRVGPAQARIAAMLLLTLRGTPTIYMGEELGQQDTPIPPEEVQDPAEQREPGRGLGRDPERTPFPWQPGPGAGFTTGTPWLRIGADVPASVQDADPESMLALYRRLITLRRAHPALVAGTISDVAAFGGVLGYRRTLGEASLRVLLNTSAQESPPIPADGVVLARSTARATGERITGVLTLRPDEGVILRSA